ncbi:hypothetical protein ABZW96_13495 [Nocardia sp. NPDC004168]|uniref:hypothetical protein n=1 Tax=Nocardia TaxID=1817 RepID=UPI0033AB3099
MIDHRDPGAASRADGLSLWRYRAAMHAAGVPNDHVSMCVIYGIKPNGDLHWYRHDGGRDGTATWTAGAGGKKISGGWDIYSGCPGNRGSA